MNPLRLGSSQDESNITLYGLISQWEKKNMCSIPSLQEYTGVGGELGQGLARLYLNWGSIFLHLQRECSSLPYIERGLILQEKTTR